MTDRPSQPAPRARQLPMFATCVPGLSRMLRHELAAIDGINTTGSGFDGPTDIVFFSANRSGRAQALRCRLAEDVYAETGRASLGVNSGRGGKAGPGEIARMAWQPDAAERALSVRAQEVAPLSGSMTYRVTVRARGQTRLRPSDLRRAMTTVIAADRPRWKFADEPQLEVRLSEWHDGQYVAGLRIGGLTRQRGGRVSEPHGALPATVAAAMIQLAGPRTAGGFLLDPCCGAGTILAEAAAVGWTAEGSDIDQGAVEVAAKHAAGVSVRLGDAREVLLPDDCVSACVSRLPGRVPGSWPDWVGEVLAELSRVCRRGGRVVLLTPDLPRQSTPRALRLRKQVPIELAGATETIWVFHRA
ncbi:MAG TPA: methyltransferase domain-containing protein [Streptosporangiaceae bacterium]|nr:methyltransferase domain-containing protein [Streptosporangiaceae bacterium]